MKQSKGGHNDVQTDNRIEPQAISAHLYLCEEQLLISSNWIMFLIFVLTELIAKKTLLSSKLIKTVLIHLRAYSKVYQLSRHISWTTEFPFQSDTPSEGGIELEAQPVDRLSEDKDNYFRDGKRKIGTQFPASAFFMSLSTAKFSSCQFLSPWITLSVLLHCL